MILTKAEAWSAYLPSSKNIPVRVPDSLLPASPGNARWSLTRWLRRIRRTDVRVLRRSAQIFLIAD